MTIAEKIVRAKEDYDNVYEAGKKSEYDTFWDAFQYNGTRTSYEAGFQAWRGASFKPKYDLILSGQYNTSTFRQARDFNLKEMTIDRGVGFDTSGATMLNGTFQQSAVGEIPPLDLSSCTSLQVTFQNLISGGYATKAITLNNLREDCTFRNVFYNAPRLESIMVTGIIGQDGFDVSSCTALSRESIESIVNALSDTAEGKTLMLSLTAVENAFPSSDDYAHWTAIVAAKPNWTILLI